MDSLEDPSSSRIDADSDWGNISAMSTKSPFHTLCAILSGTGGLFGLTMTADAAVVVYMDRPEVDRRTGSLGVDEEAAGRLNDRVPDEGFVENRGSEASDAAGGTIPTPAVRNLDGSAV